MTIKHALLNLVGQKPCGVSHLRHHFEEVTGGTWPVNLGQVYQTMLRLERDGLVEAQGKETDPDSGRSAEIYQLTDKGREELSSWYETPTLKPRNDRDELVIKFAIAAITPDADLVGMIQIQREAVIKELREITLAKKKTTPTQTANRLILERRIFDLEALARWLDHIETLAPPAAIPHTSTGTAAHTSPQEANPS